LGDLNFVIYLYIINMIMVMTDIVLSIKYRDN